MKNTYQAAIMMATVALAAALLLAPIPGRGQAPTPANAAEIDKALKDKRIAEEFEANARVLTMFDRQGKVVTTVGERAVYFNPVLSPDSKRLAVMKADLESETTDLWVLDVATGKGVPITSGQLEDGSQRRTTPVWSSDGSQLAYSAVRDGYFGLYRKASNGEGTEELLYQHPGNELFLNDWSLDGRFLGFSESDNGGMILYALPLAGDRARKPVVVFRSESPSTGPRFSPDSRFLSYSSDQSGRQELYVRPFDPSAPEATPAAGPWQVSDQGQGGGGGGASWRRDGKEMYYFFGGGNLVAVDISAAPTFTSGKPKLLFRMPAGAGGFSVSRDGERVVAAVNPAPTLQQITVLDHQGKVLSRVGEPGNYANPALSPDGTRVAVQINADVWTFDVASGKGMRVANGYAPIWSPDGSQVAYVRQMGNFRSIYRKAADGTGNEERLFQYTAGANMILTDWSADGKFLTFYPGSCGFLIFVVPLAADQKAPEREAIEWLRDEYDALQGRLSPDSRFMAYLSNEGETKEQINSEIFEIYVRPFDPGKSDVSNEGEKPVRISTSGALGGIFWRRDGKEMYYLTPDWEVMAVEIATTPTFQAGTPKLLFRLPSRPAGNPEQWKNVSADGQRFVFAIDVPVSVSAR